MDEQVTGLILAGGRGTRMGGLDKGLVLLDGRPMVEYAIMRLRPQVHDILISANRNQERYARFGYRVIADTLDGYLGPLAGVLSGLEAAPSKYVVTVPCDSPLLPDDLVAGLRDALQRENTSLAVAHDGSRLQPAFMLIERALHVELVGFLEQGGRKVEDWLALHRHAVARFRRNERRFVNVNDADQRKTVEAQLRELRLG